MAKVEVKQVIEQKIPIAPPPPPTPLQVDEKKKVANEEEQKQMALLVDKIIVSLLNNTYLSDLDLKKKLTEKDISTTNFSHSWIVVLDHYFPNASKLNHPIIPAVVSTATLFFLINGRKPIKRKSSRSSKQTSGDEQPVQVVNPVTNPTVARRTDKPELKEQVALTQF